MQDNTRLADHAAMETLCRLLKIAPREQRASLVKGFVEQVGRIPDEWSGIIDKIVHDKPAFAPGVKIRELWAYLTTEPDGTEGIAGFLSVDGWRPMIGADQERVTSLRPKAQAIAAMPGVTVKLVKFSVREELEDIKP